MNHIEKEHIVKKNILEIFKENFEVTKSDHDILNTWPEKEYETNYISYYESILDIFLIDHEHLEYITGRVKDTIKKVTELWTITSYSSPPWRRE
ncbi:hypothetical protein [Aquimarina mytili]|uniref:Uncharacterized protein n=1 Tax=Aquimarina mytili TaxID=874423 RepID=A0A936ZQ73_9FLAO|nr:hypothetical protein [Aquimarina mytili]MBL0683402.1 hypothetical protein [Aquimarina mytili]